MTYRVALLGFNAFERSAFESLFRLSARRTPAFTHCERVSDSEILIVDGESTAALARLRSTPTLPRLLVVGGKTPVQGASAHLPRPVNLMAVLKTLDDILPVEPASRHTEAKATPVPIPLRPALPPVVPSVAPAVTAEKILVVDDSDIALRFMAQRLGRFGLTVHLARSGEEALVLTAQHAFAFVFMDVSMPGLDGFKACKAIKRSTRPPGEAAPMVVMLTSRGSPIDKLRGTMAGCDAYLTKPLEEAELLKVIGMKSRTPVHRTHLNTLELHK